MKTILIFTIFIITCSLCAQPQTVVEFQTGINVARLSDPGNLTEGAIWDTRTGIIGAVTTNFSVSNELAINSGLRFVQKGMKSQFFWPGEGIVRGNLRLNYLEVPVYIKIKIADLGTTLFALGGPTISYLLSSKQEGSTDAHGDISVGSDISGIKYKTYDASVDLGISAQTPLSTDFSLLTTALYSYGLVKISDTVYDNTIGWSAPTNSNRRQET